MLVEGVRAAGEALGSGAAVRFAVCSPALTRSPAAEALLAELEARGVAPDRVGEREMAALSATASPQGILLVCEEPSVALEAMPAAGDARFLVLDGIQDPGNLGTLVRTARAFGLTAVIALDGTVDPWNARVVRASAGCVFRVPVVRAPWSEVRAWAAGAQVIVADAAGQDVATLSVTPPWMLVVGNEGAGRARRDPGGGERACGRAHGRGGRFAQRGGRGRDRALRAHAQMMLLTHMMLVDAAWGAGRVPWPTRALRRSRIRGRGGPFTVTRA